MTDHPDAHDDPVLADRGDETFVAFSELTVATEGRDVLIDAFRGRLGAVEAAPGFQRLEVWADQSDPSAFTMVSWWDSKEQFLDYMRSDRHRESHDRIPDGDHAPRAVRFRRFRVVAR